MVTIVRFGTSKTKVLNGNQQKYKLEIEDIFNAISKPKKVAVMKKI